MFFRIKVSSKNLKSLKKFLTFLTKVKNLDMIFKQLPKQKVKKFITILKSPHVNKSAQEQFEYRIYSKIINIQSIQQFKTIYLLKKAHNSTFSGVSLKVESFIEKSLYSKPILIKYNPDNMNVRFLSFKESKQNLSDFNNYIQFFDSYGEFFLNDSIMYSK